ncbi:MAG: hypothetical protein M3068_11200 [Gemmatimonadota bacterium]|nr:hypothetical protein [Gemmatimonadota bacterium]MDQ6887848.1 hypothetical protein [Gemmatimonadota bacterium]
MNAPEFVDQTFLPGARVHSTQDVAPPLLVGLSPRELARRVSERLLRSERVVRVRYPKPDLLPVRGALQRVEVVIAGVSLSPSLSGGERADVLRRLGKSIASAIYDHYQERRERLA